MRVYSMVVQAVAVTAAQDFMSVLTPAGFSGILLGAEIGQSTEFGDAADENMRVRIRRGMTTVGSGGGTVTPVDYQNSGTASTCTGRINDTTAASAGTITECYETCFNVRAGWVWTPPPQLQFVWLPSTRIAINFPAAPVDSITFSGVLYFGELA
jgi:hypothetical protein